jgi:hypothetical protein
MIMNTRPLWGFVVAGAVLGASALTHQIARAQAQDARAIDPQADALLRKMSTDLAGLKAFRFQTRQVLELVTKDGEKIQRIAESKVAVQRPNKLRAERTGGPQGVGTLYYDGKTISVHGKRNNLYATSPAPETLDAMIDFARDELSIDAPGADLLLSDPYHALMDDVVSGRYLGLEPIGDQMCHHLAYRGNETDWQIWIQDGPRALPCRFVITSKKVTGAPEFTVATDSWSFDSLPPDTFAFSPPKGAVRINFVKVSDIAKQERK